MLTLIWLVARVNLRRECLSAASLNCLTAVLLHCSFCVSLAFGLRVPALSRVACV